MRSFGKFTTVISAAIVTIWIAVVAVLQFFVWMVPGCRPVAKGFTTCDWASGIIDWLYGAGFLVGFLLFAAVPCLLVGSILWTIGAMREARGVGR